MRYVQFAFGLALCAVGVWAFNERYLKWEDCFNELGRCYDSETGFVYLEQAGATWALLTIVGAVLAFAALWRIFVKRCRTHPRS